MLRTPDNLIELAEQSRRPRELYLKYEQVCDRFKRGEKTVYAECFLKAKANNVEERKCLAYSDPSYKQYLSDWNKAEMEKVKAEVVVKNNECNLEALRSALSFDKALMENKI